MHARPVKQLAQPQSGMSTGAGLRTLFWSNRHVGNAPRVNESRRARNERCCGLLSTTRRQTPLILELSDVLDQWQIPQADPAVIDAGAWRWQAASLCRPDQSRASTPFLLTAAKSGGATNGRGTANGYEPRVAS